MALSALFPPGVREIPLLYLTLPELLEREKNEEEVALLIAPKEFWHRRLKEFTAETRENPRAAYYDMYALNKIIHGYAFELGLSCLSVSEHILSIMSEMGQPHAQYYIGKCVAEYKDNLPASEYKTTFLTGEYIRYYAALHCGDRAGICQILGVPEDASLCDEERPPRNPCSKEIIRHSIMWELDTPRNIMLYLIAEPFDKTIDLLQYVLEEYAHILTLENLFNALFSLKGDIENRERTLKTANNEHSRVVYSYTIDRSHKMQNILQEYYTKKVEQASPGGSTPSQENE